jgi:adenine-specific DNA-methyltransferase
MRGKLELTWVGKDERPRLEPRVLVEDPTKSYGDPNSENMLIFGDNLLALKALEQDFAGRVKCIYIDPPFNTGQAFELYEDGLEHSIWLSLMRERLVALRTLLSEDGTIFIHIDDNELGYLLVLADEVFGRGNRAYVVTFKQGAATGHKAINPGCVSTSNFVLIYAKRKERWTSNRVFTRRERDERYGQFIENRDEPYSKWRFMTLRKAFSVAHPGSANDDDARSLLDQFVLEHADSVIQLARPSYEGVGAATRKVIDASTAAPEGRLSGHVLPQRKAHSLLL